MSENLFSKSISEDKKLTRDDKMEFMSVAHIYSGELEANLTLSSFSLATKYPEVPMESWKKFLDYPIIKRTITAMVNEIMTKQAESDIAGGKGVRDALAVRKAMKEEVGVENNIRYVILRLPEKTGDLNE